MAKVLAGDPVWIEIEPGAPDGHFVERGGYAGPTQRKIKKVWVHDHDAGGQIVEVGDRVGADVDKDGIKLRSHRGTVVATHDVESNAADGTLVGRVKENGSI